MGIASNQPRPQRFWRSLEQYSDSTEFRRLISDEFAPGALDEDDGPSRRTFLKALAASVAAAGLSGCKPKIDEQIVPYVRQPAEVIPADRSFLPQR
jgi:molybdopterin-containing oxidoreductase family iron-sulfur binding subunit